MNNKVKEIIKNVLTKTFREGTIEKLAKLAKAKSLLRILSISSSEQIYDIERYNRYSGFGMPISRETLRAKIVVHYHILEKGITMPERKKGFGKQIIYELLDLIDIFKLKYGMEDFQVQHAVSVLKEYWNIHANDSSYLIDSNDDFWKKLKLFVNSYPELDASCHNPITKEEFFFSTNSSFPSFAKGRHTLRYYSNEPIQITKIQDAVDLARSTPTACNRQHCRVYCISNKEKIKKILEIQAGSRGFGHLADKLLLVTADLSVDFQARERHDAFVNGGMFLMNLCYALFYHKIAHCILNWSKIPDDDLRLREIIQLKQAEEIIAIVSCGNAPNIFMVASSPRSPLEEYLVID